MSNWWLSWGVWNVLEKEAESRKAMNCLEADLAAQETPKEKAVRRPREITAKVLAGAVSIFLIVWWDWVKWLGNPIDPGPMCAIIYGGRITIIYLVWEFAYWLVGPPSRAEEAVREYREAQAAQRVAKNEAIRQEKIARGL